MSFNTLQQQSLHYFSRPHSVFPAEKIVSPAAWRADDMIDSTRWRYCLSTVEIAEVEAALRQAEQSKKNTRTLTKEDFPLPTLAKKIDQWRQQVHSGQGFQVIRGMPVDKWTLAEAEKVFWCFGLHLGTPGAQNRDNDLLGHVRDDGSNVNDPSVRQYRTTSFIPYHCDAADIVGLLCLKKAQQGGSSRIVSSVTVMNDMLAANSELARRFFAPFHVDAHHEGGVLTFPIPPCRYYRGTLRTFAHTHYFRTAARYSHVRLSEQDHAALDLYDKLCDNPANYLDMSFEQGDIQLVSNHCILHSRTDYIDHVEPDRKRHLLRLWISVPEPKSLNEKWHILLSKLAVIGNIVVERARCAYLSRGASTK